MKEIFDEAAQAYSVKTPAANLISPKSFQGIGKRLELFMIVENSKVPNKIITIYPLE